MDRIVSKFAGTVESVTPSERRPNEDVVRFRVIDSEGVPSKYYELFSARTGTMSVGNYVLTCLLKSIPYADKKSGKPAAFLSVWVLDAAPLV